MKMSNISSFYSFFYYYFFFVLVPFDVYRLSADVEKQYASKIVWKMHKLLSHTQCTYDGETMVDHKKNVVLAVYDMVLK